MGENGERIRLRTLQELNDEGCGYGRVNRAHVEELGRRLDGIDNKLWALIAILFGQLVSMVGYLLTRGTP